MNTNAAATLFPLSEPPDGAVAAPAAAPKAPPRLRRGERHQVMMHCESLDQRLPAAHLARDLWTFAESIDLSPLYERIRAVDGAAGRDATDPRILFAVWLYAFSQGQGSARAVARACLADRAYEWLCGGVSVNYHLLADFRVQHWDFLNQVFTDSLGALLHEGLLHLNTTAQDGMRVQASAGKGSFRRRATLEKCMAEAQAHVEQLNQEFPDAPAAGTRRAQAARERAARERAERVQEALHQVEALAQQREARQKGEGAAARASTTDPDARTMKFPDGGFRPGYNVQFNTDVASGLIVGVDAVPQGTDAGLMDPLLEQVHQRTGQTPDRHLADGGFATVEDIEKVTARGATVYTPVKEERQKKAKGIDPFQPQAKDSPAVGAWRQRMGTAEAQKIYKKRAQTAEWVNAQARNRGFYRVRVRGLAKVQMIALWYALVHNILCAARLRRAQAGAAAAETAPGAEPA